MENKELSLHMLAATGIILLVAGLLAFVLCGVDKRRAVRQMWRIPEATLLLVGLLGGCFGLLAGMRVFRHKTKTLKFRLLVPLECILWGALLVSGCVKIGGTNVFTLA